jgi:Undecaprenyl-phosphate galactose phosphotransferase WbaP
MVMTENFTVKILSHGSRPVTTVSQNLPPCFALEPGGGSHYIEQMNKRARLRFFTIRLLRIAIDLLTISLLFEGFVLLRHVFNPDLPLHQYDRLWPFLFLVWIVFEKTGLYEGASIHSGASLGPTEEIRRLFYATTAIFIMIGFANYCYRPNHYLYSRAIFIGTCLSCLVFLPLNRLLFRKLCIRLGCHGVPAVIIGAGELAKTLFKSMTDHPEYGLNPIGYFSDGSDYPMPKNVPCLGTIDQLPERAESLDANYAILAMDGRIDCALVKQYGAFFPHLLFVPHSLLHTSSGIVPKDISGTLGLEIRHNLQIPQIYFIKRCLDYLLTLPCLLAGSVVMGIIAVLVKLDSPGPVFFSHQRIGKKRKPITIYKFRTMTEHAAEELPHLLAENPAFRQEWETYGKLEHDPRITKVGRWLRKTSLDELPQLLNVLQGRLALVGPRPIVTAELEMYGGEQDLFDRVMPGLTGLWQVSGRNHLNYADRVRLDNYYANNWSVWLDLYILAKTVYAVLFRHGAR